MCLWMLSRSGCAGVEPASSLWQPATAEAAGWLGAGGGDWLEGGTSDHSLPLHPAVRACLHTEDPSSVMSVCVCVCVCAHPSTFTCSMLYILILHVHWNNDISQTQKNSVHLLHESMDMDISMICVRWIHTFLYCGSSCSG